MRVRIPSLAELTVLLLIATLVVATLALARQEKHARDLAFQTTLEDARTLTRFMHAAHVQFSESTRGAQQSGVTRSAQDVPPPGTIHYPATFSLRLSEEITADLPHTRFRIYSDDPFFTLRPPQLDSFEMNAITALMQGDAASYWRVETGPGGAEHLRYATPIRMQASCATCHNRPEWNLRRNDWQAGDVRGVREVSLPLPETALHSPPERAMMIGLVFLCSILGLGVVYPIVRIEVARRSHFENLSIDLLELSETDPLSELANRRAFERCLETIMAGSDQVGRLGLILLDIDHFKAINDTHGHDVGDAVIRRLGHILEGAVRSCDLAARIGGEEFAVICPDVTADELAEIAERLRRDIQASRFPLSQGYFHVTASAGAALLAPGEDQATLFQRADRLLLQAKGSGRNMVCYGVAA